MTFKTVELPAPVFMVFNDDSDYYEGKLTEIKDIDEKEDTCKLVIDGIAPTPVKCTVNYSKLDAASIDYEETGIHLFLTEDDVNRWFHEHPEAREK